MDAFEVYNMYLALKRHFTPNSGYDYFKYNGKTNASKTSFDTRNDKYSFYKLSKKADPLMYMVYNFIEYGPNIWVGDLVNNEKCENTYKEYIKRKESLTYTIKSDLEQLDPVFDSNFKVIDGQYPKLLVLYIKKKITLETILVLNRMLNFLPSWKKNISDVTLWPDIYHTLNVSSRFITYDKLKVKNILFDFYDLGV